MGLREEIIRYKPLLEASRLLAKRYNININKKLESLKA